MAFTGRLGTSDSRLANIELGVAGGGAAVETSFTADAFIQPYFRADAVILRTQSASFTADAFITAAPPASFTANAVILKTQAASFTADAYLAGTVTTSFAANAVVVVATRFYFNPLLAPNISPAYAAGWESTASAQRRIMGRPSDAYSIAAGQDGSVSETSTSGTFDVLIYQFVSPPLFAGVICGPIGGYIRAAESNVAADFRSQMVVRVVSNDGTTVVGTALDFNGDALTDEWPTTDASRRFPLAFSGLGTNATPVTVAAGDRLVIEVGYRAHNVSSTQRTGTLRRRHQFGGTDFSSSGSTSDLNPWIDVRATTYLLPIEKVLTADAFIQPYFRADAVLVSYRVRHSREGPHTGTDTDLGHDIAWGFDRYLRGENLQEVLIDLDARLTAREGGRAVMRRQLFLNSIMRKTQSASLTLDAFRILVISMLFTADASLAARFHVFSWIIDPAIYLDDSVLTAPTWPVDTRPRAAFINTASLTWDSTNDPDWWFGPGNAYVTAWFKFTLSSTKTVILDTLRTQGDTVIELWGGGPPSWPADPIAWADEEIANEDSPYPWAEYMEVTLNAGTYWVLLHKFNVSDPDFSLTVRIRTTT